MRDVIAAVRANHDEIKGVFRGEATDGAGRMFVDGHVSECREIAVLLRSDADNVSDQLVTLASNLFSLLVGCFRVTARHDDNDDVHIASYV
jgi:hypothetical protein